MHKKKNEQDQLQFKYKCFDCKKTFIGGVIKLNKCKYCKSININIIKKLI